MDSKTREITLITNGIVPGFSTAEGCDPFYTSYRKFRSNSPLRHYLKQRYPVSMSPKEHTLIDVLIMLERCIRHSHMYHEQNPFVAICDPHLTEALHQKHILCSDIQFEVIKQMVRRPEDYEATEGIDEITKPIPGTDDLTLYAPTWSNKASIAYIAAENITTLEIDSTFQLKYDLRQTLELYKAIDTKKDIFTFGEIMHGIALTLLRQGSNKLNREEEISIINLENTAMGKLLGVPAIDFRQMDGLILQHLTPVNATDMQYQRSDDELKQIRIELEKATTRDFSYLQTVKTDPEENHKRNDAETELRAIQKEEEEARRKTDPKLVETLDKVFGRPTYDNKISLPQTDASIDLENELKRIMKEHGEKYGYGLKTDNPITP